MIGIRFLICSLQMGWRRESHLNKIKHIIFTFCYSCMPILEDTAAHQILTFEVTRDDLSVEIEKFKLSKIRIIGSKKNTFDWNWFKSERFDIVMNSWQYIEAESIKYCIRNRRNILIWWHRNKIKIVSEDLLLYYNIKSLIINT